jgi:hypothetical protein
MFDVTVRTTEYTESGNCHFLEYILSRWRNQPSLLRLGGARPPLFTKSIIAYTVVVYAPAERADTLPDKTLLLFLLYPNTDPVVQTYLVWILEKLIFLQMNNATVLLVIFW